MNASQLYKDLVNNEELKDIPLVYVCRVAVVVLKLIQGNKYVYRIGE